MPNLGSLVSISPANLIGSLIFGSIGFAAFIYGKKTGGWKAMMIGVGLAVFPYAVQDTLGLYLTGALLTSALFIFRD